MDKQTIVENLQKWNFWNQDINTGVERKQYLKELEILLNIPEVIALIGVRRSGKSILCYQLLEKLIKIDKVPKQNTLFINFEDPFWGEKVSLTTLTDIYQAYLEDKAPKGKIYLFLDEVQKVEKWEKFVLSLYDSHQQVKVFVTGSNSSLLESNISTLLSGRYLIKKIFPLNFSEFLDFKNINLNMITNQAFIFNLLQEYLRYGGFPRVVLEKDITIKNYLLQEYYNSIIEKDIIFKNNIKNKVEVKNLALYIMSNVGSLFSTYATAKKLDIAHQNINNYLNFFEEAFLISRISKFDYSVKKQIYNPDKLFVVDTGLSQIAGFSFSENIGHYLENLVFQYYSQKRRQLYYWKNGTEIDFVIKEGIKSKKIINVCYSLNEITGERETTSFEKAKKIFPKVEKELIYWEKSEKFKNNRGIKLRRIIDLLLER